MAAIDFCALITFRAVSLREGNGEAIELESQGKPIENLLPVPSEGLWMWPVTRVRRQYNLSSVNFKGGKF